MQLDHEMISTYSSSRDEDKIKPLRSILCLYPYSAQLLFLSQSLFFSVSSFKEIKPVDWKRPRHIDVVFESSQGVIESTVEHDTIEAARDWRNEFHRMSFSPLSP